MPEIWIPFGPVETLVTVQGENMGAAVQPEPEAVTRDAERLSEALKSSTSLFICDSAPTTFEVLKELAPTITASPDLRLYSSAPKHSEASVPDLKGRVSTLAPPVRPDEQSTLAYAPELIAQGRKIFVGTVRPDPLFGIVDPRVQACLNWVAGSLTSTSQARREMEPEPFHKTDSYDAAEALTEKFQDPTFLAIIPRGGRARAVLEDPPFDAEKNGFVETPITPSKALVVGIGGRGYDDTFSSAIRGVWSALPAAKKSADLLIVAECSEGLGSTALEMLATGRMGSEGRRREKYIDGLEEVFYLNKLRDEFDVLLLSGLPETYARDKLGLATAKGSGEAVGRLLNKAGRSAKVNVVTRANECRLSSS